MPTLVISHPFRGRVEHPLNVDTVTIGRLSDNMIQIRDESVSGRHARIVKRNGAYRIEDLGSTNRCYVNGRETAEAELVEPCTIRLGNVVCEYRTEDTAADPIADQFSVFQKQIQSILADRDDALSGKATVEAERDKLAAQIDKLQNERDAARKEAAESLEKLASSEKRFEDTTRDLRTLRDAHERATREVDERRRENALLASQLDSTKLSAVEARAKLSDMTGEFQAVRSEADSLRNGAADLKSRAEVQARQVTSLTAQRDELQSANDQLSAKYAESRQRVDSVMRQHEKVLREYEDARSELASMAEGAEHALAWFERIARHRPASGPQNAPASLEKPIPPKFVKPVRVAEEKPQDADFDEMRVTKKIELPPPPAKSPSNGIARSANGGSNGIPAQAPGTKESGKPAHPPSSPILAGRGFVPSGRESILPLLSNMRKLLSAFASNRSDIAPFTEVLRDAYNLTQRTATIDSNALFNLASALEALIRDLQHMPTRITDSALETVRNAIDLLEEMMRPECLKRTSKLLDARIFVIDDDPETRNSVIAAMNSVNLKPSYSPDKAQILARVGSQDLDLVLIDQECEFADGQDALSLVRGMPNHHGTPVILIRKSGSDLPPGVEQSNSISKPFNHRELAVKALTSLFRGQLGAGSPSTGG